MSPRARAVAVMLSLLATSATAQDRAEPAPATVSPVVAGALSTLAGHDRIKAALAAIRADEARAFLEQREISEIAAPPFGEGPRAADFRRRLTALGLRDVRIDAEGNVLARRPGRGGGPTLVVSAHLDTVFPAGTDVAVKAREGSYYGPGLADDARGLAVLLTLARAMDAARIATIGDLWLVATVGEEGLGDLRGVKALFRDHQGIDGFISIDGVGLSTVTTRATGSRRWRIVFKGPGGHSFGDFGRPSAAHALGRATAAIADLDTPAQPRTTFTVGTVTGGSSVNAIAAEAVMEIDLRSDGAAELAALEQRALNAIDQAVAAENHRWGSQGVTAQPKLVGDRPGGHTPSQHPIVEAATEAAMVLGDPRPSLIGTSTDSNVPMALGVPAVTLRGGGEGGNLHAPTEWYRPTDAWKGAQRALLTTVALLGVDGVSEPLLPRRSIRPAGR